MVVWFPWVSSNEVDLSNPNSKNSLIIFYVAAFVLTLLIETLINITRLKKQYPTQKIMSATIICNVISYVIGSFVLYAYSFK